MIDPDFARDGACRHRGAVAEQLPTLLNAVAHLTVDRAGIRITDAPALRPVLSADGAAGIIAAQHLGAPGRPVRAVLFDKTPTTNWALAWHQDRTICVRERHDTPGYGPWTVKDGRHHVTPPFDLLAAMVTLRIHLDAVTCDNAPLLIAPGSHRTGRIAVADVAAGVARRGQFACLADPGDVWAYAAPILHASEAARRPCRRRVLQVDYAATTLPGGLEWTGV